MIKVVFTYDSYVGLWEPVVEGAVDANEAREAFNAVAISCTDIVLPRVLSPNMINHLGHLQLHIMEELNTNPQSWQVIPAIPTGGSI